MKTKSKLAGEANRLMHIALGYAFDELSVKHYFSPDKMKKFIDSNDSKRLDKKYRVVERAINHMKNYEAIEYDTVKDIYVVNKSLIIKTLNKQCRLSSSKFKGGIL